MLTEIRKNIRFGDTRNMFMDESWKVGTFNVLLTFNSVEMRA